MSPIQSSQLFWKRPEVARLHAIVVYQAGHFNAAVGEIINKAGVAHVPIDDLGPLPEYRLLIQEAYSLLRVAGISRVPASIWAIALSRNRSARRTGLADSSCAVWIIST